MSNYYYTPKYGEKVAHITYYPIDGTYGYRATRHGVETDSSAGGEYDTQGEAIQAAQRAHPWTTIVNPWGRDKVILAY